MRKAYIESFIILLFLSCCPFIVSSCHEEEKEEIPESPFDEEDIQHEQVWGIERSGFFNGREKWAKGFENQRV
ncbi:hypothetical protein ACMSE6_03560 [Bacteroides thetaiotaomicron]|uniref:hypothetical protein n=1 Tax=Bacteroides thetaiotaomicron TaxID=818 RepID=UPI0039C11DCB